MYCRMLMPVLFSAIVLCGCSKAQDVYVYQEIVIKEEGAQVNTTRMDQASAMGVTPPQQHNSVGWNTPTHWVEEPGSGFRLATFKDDAAQPTIDCSIVTLSGVAGGVQANVARWMGQIAMPVLSVDELNKFITDQEVFTTVDGNDGLYVDLSHGGQSILAGIIKHNEQTIFIKMTGSTEAINNQKDSFKGLATSLRFDVKQ